MSSTTGYLLVLPWDVGHIGGVNQVVANLYDEMRDDGRFRPFLLIADWNCGTPLLTRESGRDVVRFRLRPPSGKGCTLRSMLGTMLYARREQAALASFLTGHSIKFVNVHYPIPGCLVFQGLRERGLADFKLIVSLHGLDIRSTLALSGEEDRRWRKFYSDADIIVPCSRGLSNDVQAYEPELMKKVRVVYNGIDSKRLQAEQNRQYVLPNRLSGRKYVVNVGTYEHKKGHDVLLRAFRKVVDRHPDMMLVTIGRSGETSSTTACLISELNLAANVVMLENVGHADVLSFLANASMFVLSSRNEGFAVVLLEAGAFGLPVVATDVCGVSELVDSGETGLLVPSEDAEKLATAICFLLENDEDRNRMAHALQLRVQAAFTWKKTYLGYKSIVEDL